jgi:uncharacterized protein YdhG (YjbR/CyaY superfamily)
VLRNRRSRGSGRVGASKAAGDAAAVRAYLATVPAGARAPLQQIRDAIRALAPGAVEARSYGILGYKLDGRALLYCAGWKEHVSLYPVTDAMRREHADAMRPFIASKGTLRFPVDTRLPITLIRRLIKTRLAEMREAGKAARAV